MELKYALSIEQTHHYLREQVKIYYDPKTLRATGYIQDHIRTYTPDFLIRNKFSNTATLIEIKPNGVLTEQEKEKLEIIAGCYILQDNYDWGFKIVYGEDIGLNKIQTQKLALLVGQKDAFQAMLDFQKLEHRYNNNSTGIFHSIPFAVNSVAERNKYIHFIRTGKK